MLSIDFFPHFGELSNYEKNTVRTTRKIRLELRVFYGFHFMKPLVEWSKFISTAETTETKRSDSEVR